MGMKVFNRSIVRGVLAGATGALLLGAQGPIGIAPALPGLWEVARSATGADAARICVREAVALSQWEHREARCTRAIIADGRDRTLVEYVCVNGGFGRSEMTLVTPRTLKIATQGISRDGPFAYTLHARRVGNCAPR